jgi:hypothetical protein
MTLARRHRTPTKANIPIAIIVNVAGSGTGHSITKFRKSTLLKNVAPVSLLVVGSYITVSVFVPPATPCFVSCATSIEYFGNDGAERQV